MKQSHLFPQKIQTPKSDQPSGDGLASVQKRLPKYRRTEESAKALANRRITDRSLNIISYLSFYNVLPTSLMVHLVEGNKDNIYRHLQTLYHKKLINRFAFPSSLNPGEFNYYLDNPTALDLLIDAGWAEPEDLDFDRVRYNREKKYGEIHFEPERQGSLLYLNHEIDISRFHAMLELGCRASGGRVELIDWRQGPELWGRVVAPKVAFDGQRNLWGEEDHKMEKLPHRPDAFFGLRFQDRPEDRQDEYFFYERDRKTTRERKRIVRKLRAHFQYVVKQQQHKTDYGIKGIRAVLVETTDDEWAMELLETARHPLVSGPQPSPLFWFTHSGFFELGLGKGERSQHEKRKDFFLAHPEIIFHSLWAAHTPSGIKLYSLQD